jgi:hypothetical protein
MYQICNDQLETFGFLPPECDVGFRVRICREAYAGDLVVCGLLGDGVCVCSHRRWG